MRKLESETATGIPASLRIIGFLLSVFLCLFLIPGCASTQEPSGTSGGSTTHSGADPSQSVQQATSYQDIYGLLEEAFSSDRGAFSGGMVEEAEIAPLSDNATAKDSAKSASGTDASYSETNVQVAGIDEADVVKTDGEHLYILSRNTIIIAKAAGEETKEIARITLDADTLQREPMTNSWQALELYISDGTLVVLYQYSPDYLLYEDGSNYQASNRSVSEVALFDISTPESPRLLKTFGQDGYYSSSRLKDGILYLISNYYIYDATDLSRENPITYVPLTMEDGKQSLTAPEKICVFPTPNSTSYTVITSIDLGTCTRIDDLSVLGAGETIYMSHENIYVAGLRFDSTEENSYQDGSFLVTEYRNGYTTSIAKLSIDKGTLAFAADTTISGNLLNQFSLDEYEENLRLVTTVDYQQYRTLDDGKDVIYDYDFESTPTTNSLLVLDKNLETIGAIEGLAEDERVYSVRFDGSVGYFVTFREIDPLFAVDLSDPHKPEIKDALKIPGFSTYLHPYSEGRLFGIGMSATMDGRTTGLKMSMFDTSDPYNISEKHLHELALYYSEALYEHKAIFVNADLNLIGFPGENNYVVFEYSDEEGFSQKAELEIADSSYYYPSLRGIHIDDFFYLCGATGISVYTLDTFEPVVELKIETDDLDYVGVMPLVSDEKNIVE